MSLGMQPFDSGLQRGWSILGFLINKTHKNVIYMYIICQQINQKKDPAPVKGLCLKTHTKKKCSL